MKYLIHLFVKCLVLCRYIFKEHVDLLDKYKCDSTQWILKY